VLLPRSSRGAEPVPNGRERDVRGRALSVATDERAVFQDGLDVSRRACSHQVAPTHEERGIRWGSERVRGGTEGSDLGRYQGRDRQRSTELGKYAQDDPRQIIRQRERAD